MEALVQAASWLDGVNNLITDLIRYAVGLSCMFVALMIVLWLFGYHVETVGIFRCRQVHPKHGTRCALKSGGHFGVRHRDRRGRSWI